MSLFLPTFILDGGAPSPAGDASSGSAGDGAPDAGAVDTSVESAAAEAEALLKGPDTDKRMADIMADESLSDDDRIAKLLELQLDEEEQRKQAEFEKQEKRPGFDETLARLKESDPDAYALMRSLRAQATRKSQEVAAKERNAESLLTALLGSETVKGLQEAAAKGDEKLDPWSPESVEKAIEAKVAQKLQALLKPMEEARQQREAADAYRSWVESEAPELADTPENADFRQEVKAAMTKEGLGVKAAYATVKLKRVQAMLEKKSSETSAIKEAVRKRGLKLTGGRSGVMPDLQESLVAAEEELSANDIYERLMRAQKS